MATSYKTYYRGAGKKRPTRLYQIWDNMRSRVSGTGTKRPDLYEGLEIEWKTFAEFRAWAISTGFRKGLSPDRIDTQIGYMSWNLRWVPVQENRMRAISITGGVDDVRGVEPPPRIYEETGTDVPF